MQGGIEATRADPDSRAGAEQAFRARIPCLVGLPDRPELCPNDVPSSKEGSGQRAQQEANVLKLGVLQHRLRPSRMTCDDQRMRFSRPTWDRGNARGKAVHQRAQLVAKGKGKGKGKDKGKGADGA